MSIVQSNDVISAEWFLLVMIQKSSFKIYCNCTRMYIYRCINDWILEKAFRARCSSFKATWISWRQYRWESFCRSWWHWGMRSPHSSGSAWQRQCQHSHPSSWVEHRRGSDEWTSRRSLRRETTDTLNTNTDTDTGAESYQPTRITLTIQRCVSTLRKFQTWLFV